MCVEQSRDGVGLIRPPLHDAKPQSDLTNGVYENVTLASTDLHQCLFTGSLFRGCRFDDVDFSNSDFDGVKIENCTFTDCDFTDCDMRASTVSSTAFIDTSFESIYLHDSAFERCTLDRINLHSAAAAENSFRDCTIRECDLGHATFTHSQLTTCTLEMMNFVNCTFLYIVFRECRFVECSINTESVGMLYGIPFEALAHFDFFHLGQKQEKPGVDELLSSLVMEYAGRGWHLGQAVMRLGFRLTSALFAIRTYMATVNHAIATGGWVKRDDIEFFVTVLGELAAERRLPLLGCLDVVEAAWRAIHTTSERPALEYQHASTNLINLSSRMLLLTQQQLDYFNRERLQIEQIVRDEYADVVFEFERQPDVLLEELLTAVSRHAELDVSGPAYLLDSYEGSYVAKIRATIITMVAAQTVLFLLNGCVIQLTELKERINVLTSPGSSPEYIARAIDPNQSVPPVVRDMLEATSRWLRSSEIVADPALKGLSENNLRRVTVARAKSERSAPQQ